VRRTFDVNHGCSWTGRLTSGDRAGYRRYGPITFMGFQRTWRQ